ncbi:MAG TPA: tetratricopeptide repeat protein [Leptospiraceae bacterium]|nr:tetratricopeptide repeat protein [Leptospiraceae bacterium]
MTVKSAFSRIQKDSIGAGNMSAVKKNTVKFEMHLKKGNDYFSDADYPKALREYAKAVELDSGSAEAYYRIGSAYFNLAEYPNAVQNYTECLKIDPKHIQAYIERAGAYANLGDLDSSIEDLKTVLKLDKNHSDARFALKQGEELRKMAAKLCSAVDKKIDKNSNDPFLYNEKGLILQKAGEHILAVREFRKALNLKKDYAEAAVNCGISLYWNQDWKLCIDMMTSAAKLDKKNARIYSFRGLAWQELKNFKKAVSDFKQALELDPEDEYAGLNIVEAEHWLENEKKTEKKKQVRRTSV